MPPCDAVYLIGYLFEVGPTLSGGMSLSPLSHAEIAAWQGNIGIELDAWESRMLKRLSNEYCEESHKAAARDCPIPWADAPYAKPAPNLIAERMKQATRELANL